MNITRHAYYRGKQRLGLKPRALDKLADRALSAGVTPDKTRGELAKYLQEVQKGQADNLRIYGEVLYFFYGRTLLTLYTLPSTLKKYLKRL